MPNAVIIGAGPAGISAAIYLARANVQTTVIYKDYGALTKAHAIENYYGFPNPISGPDLFNNGLQQAINLGVNIIQDEVLGIEWNDKMTPVTKSDKFPADVVIIATGSARIAPKIPGLKQFEGTGVSYCAICDAFFYRKKNVAVIGNGPYALHEASILADSAASVTIFTLGKPQEFDNPDKDNIKVDLRNIIALNGDDQLKSITLEDNSSLDIDGLFVALGVAGSADFAKKLGAEIDGVRIIVDDNCKTSLDGLYACGDCNGGMLQVAKAVYDGAKAANHAIKYLKSL